MLELDSAVCPNPLQPLKRAHRKQIQTMEGPGVLSVLISTHSPEEVGKLNSTIQ